MEYSGLSFDSKHQLARIFHELLSRDRVAGRATWQPQGVGSEAYLNGTSQGPTPEDARKGGHMRGRSRLFVTYPGQTSLNPARTSLPDSVRFLYPAPANKSSFVLHSVWLLSNQYSTITIT